MTTNIETIYQNGLLADSAYIEFGGLYNTATGEIFDKNTDPKALEAFQKRGFTEKQFEEFIDRYKIIEHVPNDVYGFSATLFKDTKNGNKPIVAYRGTETSSIASVAQDVLIQDVFGVFIGFSSLLGQSNSSGSAFQDWIDAGHISASKQATVVGHSLGGHLSLMAGAEYDAMVDSIYTYNGAGLNGWDALFNLSDITDSKVHRVVSETGYEMTASDVFMFQVGELHEISINRQPLVGLLDSWFTDASINHHYMVHLVDSLSVMRVLSALDNTLSEKDMNSIFLSASNHELEKILHTDSTLLTNGEPDNSTPAQAALSHNMILNHLATMLGGDFTNLDTTNEAEQFYQKISGGHNVQLKQLSYYSDPVATATIDSTNAGIALRYALLSGTSFVVIPAETYEEGIFKSTEPTNYAYAQDQHSEQFWIDRLDFHNRLMERNQNDRNDTGTGIEAGAGSSQYYDLYTSSQMEYGKTEIHLRGSEAATDLGRSANHHIIFGSSGNDDRDSAKLESGTGNDRIYGMGGNDYLDGASGNDILDGGTGNDELYGGEGDDDLFGGKDNDTLTGGAGRDILVGGEGTDRYEFGLTDGIDEIYDNDGVIYIDGKKLESVTQINAESGIYEDTNGNRIIVMDDGILVEVGGSTENMIMIRDPSQLNNFGHLIASTGDSGLPPGVESTLSVSDFGITLNEPLTPEEPELPTGLYTVGDGCIAEGASVGTIENKWEARDGHTYQGFINEVGVDVDTSLITELWNYDAATDQNGDPLVSATNSDHETSYDFYFEGTDQKDVLTGGYQGEILYGRDGDDIINGNGGFDTLQGGAGADHIKGGDGSDRIFGYAPNKYEEDGSLIASYVGESANGDDTLDGEDGNDWISGGQGNDLMTGGVGEDHLYGGEGKDTIIGGVEKDFIFGDSRLEYSAAELGADLIKTKETGQEYDDIIIGGAGEDELYGELGNDTIDGGADNDFIHGDRHAIAGDSDNDLDGSLHGNDTLIGGAGEDEIVGDGGNDTIYGGLEKDIIFGDNSSLDGQYHGQDTISGGEGNDEIVGGGGDDIISGGVGSDIIAADEDLFVGETTILLDGQYHGDDTVDAGDGFDKVHGGGGNDTIYGGEGNDQLWGDSSYELVTTTELGVELIRPTTANLAEEWHGDDVIYGGSGEDTIVGGAGNDQLFGGDDNDTLHGNKGADHIEGGAGSDWLLGDEGNDTLIGGAGSDILLGGDGEDVLEGGAGNSDHMHGGEGNDTYNVSLGDGQDYIKDTQGSNTVNLSGVNVDNLRLKFDNEGTYLILDALEHNWLYTWGNTFETLNLSLGGGGVDTEVQLQAKDLDQNRDYRSSTASMTFNSGSGEDNIHTGYGDDIVNLGAGDDILSTGYGRDTITGGIGNDVLAGGEGNDTYYFNVGDGVDSVYDSGGIDSVILDSGYGLHNTELTIYSTDLIISNTQTGDQITIANQFSGRSIENITFSTGNSIVLGTSYFDHLTGSDGSDWIFTAGGSDTLTGGSGDDLLQGGGGDDTYVYNLGDGQDTITDQHGLSTIRFGVGISAADLSLQDIVGGMRLSISQSSEVVGSITFTKATSGTTLNLLSKIELNDGSSLSGAELEALYAGNRAPYVSGSDPIRIPLYFDYANSFVLPDNTFVVREEGEVHYLANLANGDPLPDWLKFDSQTLSLTANGREGELSSVDVLITVVDSQGLTASKLIDFNAPTHIIYGTNDNPSSTEEIYASDLDVDQVHAGAGRDIVYIGNGQDALVLAGEGNDYVDGSFGKDTIYGESGKDVLEGDWGDDYLNGGSEDDKLYGDDGHDVLIGEQGDDELYGGDDSDYLDGGAGFDSLEGGNGNDTLYGREEDDDLFGEGGNDILSGGSGSDDLYGGSGDDILAGGAGEDELYGGEGNDVYLVEDGFGADYIDFRTLINSEVNYVYITANVNSNTAIYSKSFGSLKIEFPEKGETLELAGYFDLDRNGDFYGMSGPIVFAMSSNSSVLDFATVKTKVLEASELGETINGFDSPDEIYGLAGSDVINGFGGNDKLYGGNGVDTLDGGAGNDELNGGNGGDILTDDIGDDTLIGGDGGDILSAGRGNDKLYGDAGIDVLDGGIGNDELHGGPEGDTLTGGDGNDHLYGGSGQDNLNGGHGKDVLYGGDDNDTLTAKGSYGDDDLHGESGSDTFIVEGSSANLFGGTGSDIYNLVVTGNQTITIDDQGLLADYDQLNVSYDSGNASHVLNRYEDDLHILVNFEQSSSVGQIKIINWFKPENTIEDISINSVLLDAAALLSESLFLSGIDDIGEETLNGNGGSDYIDGGAGSDIISGGSGGDVLVGGDGNDTLTGGNGSDVLLGGAGNDTFIYEDLSSRDIIDGGDGIDTVVGSSASETMLLGDIAAIEIIDGGTGSNAIRASTGSTLDLSDIELRNIESILSTVDTRIIGSSEDDNVVVTVNNWRNSALIDGYNSFDQVVEGGAGNDTFTIKNNSGADVRVQGGEGFDTLVFGSGVDTVRLLHANDELEVINGGDGTNTLNAFNLDLTNTQLINIDEIRGTNITGTTFRDVITGSGTISGGAGSDKLYGSSSASTYNLSALSNKLYGNDGDDEIYASTRGDKLYGGAGYDTLIGSTGADTLDGGSEKDMLNGGAGGDFLYSNGDMDTLIGGDGDDTYYVQLDGDVVIDNTSSDDGIEKLYINQWEDGLSTFTDLLFSYDGDDVKIAGKNGAAITIKDWFLGDSYKIDELNISGYTLNSTEIEQRALGVFENSAPVSTDFNLYINSNSYVYLRESSLLSSNSDPDADTIYIHDLDVNWDHGVNWETVGRDYRITLDDVNYSGVIPLNYMISDGKDTFLQTFNLNVNYRNTAPEASNDRFSLQQGEIFSVHYSDLLGNDSDINPDDVLSVLNVSDEQGGIVQYDTETGMITFEPESDSPSVAGFSYQISDGLNSDTAQVTLDYSYVAPIASSDSVATQTNEKLIIAASTLLVNDLASDISNLEIISVSQAMGGQVAYDDLLNTITFVPDADFSGTGIFLYTITDGEAIDSTWVTVNIDGGVVTNYAPVANDELVTTNEDTAITIDVLANDSDLDGDALLVTNASANNGIVLQNLDGSLEYTPNENFSGTDSISYEVSDGNGGTDSAIVTIVVMAENDSPDVYEGVYDQNINQNFDFSFTIPSSSFSDADGDALTYTAIETGSETLPGWLNFDGQTFTGTPTNGQVGTYSISVTASDGVDTSTTTFELTVDNVNDAPVVNMALADVTAVEGALFTLTIPTDSFIDIDAGDTLEYSVKLTDGSPWPSWLSFDPSTRTLTAASGTTEVGVLGITVTAMDLAGAKEHNQFTLTINEQSTSTTAPIVIQAEDGVLNTHSVAMNNTGYAGSGFVDIIDEGEISYNVTASAGSYELDVRYALGSGNRPLQLEVNGLPVDMLAFTSTGSWTNWLDESIQINLVDGENIIKLITTGSSGANIDQLTLTPMNISANNAPVVNDGVADQVTIQDADFSFTIPGSSFSDADGDTLTYTAVEAGSDMLPSWLSFDGQTFTGQPTNEEVGNYNIEVTASDGRDSEKIIFELSVDNVNDKPVVNVALSDATTIEGAPFTLIIPADSFIDIDAGDSLEYSVKLTDGSPWPSWLSFDPSTRTLTAASGTTEVGVLDITVTATDLEGAKEHDQFTVTVTAQPEGNYDSITVQAEDGVFIIHEVATNNAGYIGSGFVDMVGEGEISYNVTANAGLHDLDIRYALSIGSRPLQLEVNGNQIVTLNFTSTGSWTNWLNESLQVTLLEGQNNIKLKTTGSSGANIDQFQLNFAGYNDVLGSSDPETLSGTNSRDKLLGFASNDVLIGGQGDDLLDGGDGNDTYQFSMGDGRDVISQSDASGHDDLQLMGGFVKEDLWYSREGDRLIIDVLGSTDQIAVNDWFAGDQHQLDQVSTASSQIESADIELLVEAMASFGAPAGGEITLSSEQREQANTSIAAAWQPA